MTPRPPSRRPQGRHAGITRAAVLDAALAFVDREGLEALSMRRLGGELGVEAMTLYHHVGSKEALLDGVVERLLTDLVPEREDAASSWRELLRTSAWALYDRLAAHPHLIPVVATRPAVTPGTLAVLEREVAALHAAGFAPARALEIAYAVIGLVLGHVGVGGRFDDLTGERSRNLAGADLSDYPLLCRAVEDGVDVDGSSSFTLALDAVLDGLAPPR
ncbi:TetR/AcrR family transcriptional regulator [Georgenia deserti]|uniref:TetR/AcrR family transcriptional regulator n=1 Tax=Georgenia deserti TaxID=2093781 RepID=A0ABW4L6T5_9MICO